MSNYINATEKEIIQIRAKIELGKASEDEIKIYFKYVDKIEEVWLGDCLELMKNIPDKSIDMILCDLPYGTTACKWDVIIPFGKLWDQYNRIIKDNAAILLFGDEPFSSNLRLSNLNLFKYDWYWIKTQPSGIALANKRPMKYTEIISTFYKKQPVYNKQMTERWSEKAKTVVKRGVMGKHHTVENGAKLNVPEKRFYNPELVNPKNVLFFNSVPNGGGHKLHPTQKPVELLEYLIKTYTNENALILDNCAGSGSTLVAAKNLNRQFIGIEKEKQYYETILTRLNKNGNHS